MNEYRVYYRVQEIRYCTVFARSELDAIRTADYCHDDEFYVDNESRYLLSHVMMTEEDVYNDGGEKDSTSSGATQI